ncbi:SLC13 family permease [Roseibium sediminicola]|uniref:SLC13 family permease n=1 Tax=Roseibium sediminicola TaxID=2933272 RepID=A0ABT0GWG5_9HYPH|nr:SLC13 family permease [Roseibium sp. CAU 1639]MCK7613791.1 SLC13 family permease [Roseibium sp. CAU 1639]
MLFDLGFAAPFAALFLVTAVFFLFIREVYAAEVVALLAVAAALLSGMVSIEDVLKAFGNPAPATIGAMFVISAALVRTGVLETVANILKKGVEQSPKFTIALFFSLAGVASAFMNNTPVVMILIPVVFSLARELGTSASRLLMPLSFIVILGGTCSLIGTSTNLLVDGVSQELGFAPFSLFEIAPLGIVLAITGGLFLAVAAPRLLPQRASLSELTAPRESKAWRVELFVPHGSLLVGKPLLEIRDFQRRSIRIVDLVRQDLSLRQDLDKVRLQAGDRVILRATDAEIMAFRDQERAGVEIAGAELAAARRNIVMEVLVSSSKGPISDLGWRRLYRVYPVAIHRRGEAIDVNNSDLRLEPGDTVLLDGTAEDIERIASNEDLIPLAPITARSYRTRRAPVAICILAAVVIGAALDLAPILPLAIIGAAAVLATRCVDPEEGIGAIDGRLLLLIVSMLVLGTALEKTGAMEMIVRLLSQNLAGLPPLVALAVVYAFASLLTEVVSNNAIAVIMTPVAAGVAVQLGLDPRAFIVAVMFGASASFATPIGYQTNTMVYNAGGYRFGDFIRLGLPMNVLAGLVTVIVAPMIWPLTP